MRRTSALVSFLALVTGCSESQRSTPPKPQEAQSEGYSARFEWMSNTYEGEAGLLFAIPETDAVGVSLHCGRGARSARVSAIDPTGAGTRLVLGSGAARGEVESTPSHDWMIDDSVFAAAIVPIDHPALAALERSGELWVWNDQHPMRAETDAERGVIARFFQYCDG